MWKKWAAYGRGAKTRANCICPGPLQAPSGFPVVLAVPCTSPKGALVFNIELGLDLEESQKTGNGPFTSITQALNLDDMDSEGRKVITATCPK